RRRAELAPGHARYVARGARRHPRPARRRRARGGRQPPPAGARRPQPRRLRRRGGVGDRARSRYAPDVARAPRPRRSPGPGHRVRDGAPVAVRQPRVGELMPIQVSEEVQVALATGRPVVALESTIIAHGLPWPDNLEVATAMEGAVRAAGAIPATV